MAIVKSLNIDKLFLLHCLRSDLLREQLNILTNGSTRQSLGIKTLRELSIPLPPIPEQKKIAEILSGISHLIQVKSKKIRKLNDLKKAIINKFMIINKQTSVPLKRIAKCQGGFAFKSSDSQQKGAKWLKIANVSLGKIDWENKSFLPNDFKEKYSDFVLNKGDIVLAMTRPIIRNQLKVFKVRRRSVA